MESQTAKIILGTVQFGLDYGISNLGGKIAEPEAGRILDSAKEGGIKLLDTAQGYGNALEVIGNYHSTHRTFGIISKFKAKPVEELRKELHRALEILKVDQLYVWMYHRASDLQEFPEIADLLEELKKDGKISHAGISVYTNDELRLAIETEFIKVIQLPFNLLDNYSRRGELILKAKEAGKEIHVRSIFLQGLFYKPFPFPPILELLQKNVETLYEIAKENQLSMTELALRYALSFPEIDYCILGVQTLQQLKENLIAAGPPLEKKCIEKIHNLVIQHPELLNPGNWK